MAALAVLSVGGLAVSAGLGPPRATPPGPAASREPTRAAAADSGVATAPVAGSLVDVALLPPGGRDAAPRLLTVDHDTSAPGRAVLTVLERSGGRWNARAGEEHRPPTLARTAVPWLVAIDERRFVLVTVAPEAAVTWLAGITWTGEALRVGPVGSVAGIADAATAADASGDGTRDLVLVESRTRRGGGTCQGSRLTVLDGSTLRVETELGVPNLRLAAGATGELDATSGADLVAAAYTNCPAGPATPNRLRIVGVRLADGRVLADRPVEPADTLIAWSGRPAVVDVDGDSRSEVLIGSRRSLVVLEPARGWEASEVGGAPGVLLGAVGTPDSTGVTVASMAEDAVRISRLQRNRDRWTVTTTKRVDEAAVGSARWSAATLDVRATAIRSGGSGWLLEEGACPSLVAPLAIAACDPALGTGAGPAWIATRPIATLPDRRLLVAQTDEWRAPGVRLVAPSPVAIEHDGAPWRHGPSEPFSLVEVAATLGSPVVPETIVETLAAGSAPSVGVAGVPGTRLVATTSVGGPTRPDVAGGSLAGLLAVLPRDRATIAFLRIPASGRLELALPRPPDGMPPAWTVARVAIGPLGDVSVVVGSSVEVDTLPPPVALEDAFVRPPWPLVAPVSGSTEPGVTVSDGTREVVAGEDGRFTLDARLAPWPQRLTVRATDAAGNAGSTTAELVGGPDLRRLPWIPILALSILLGAALSGLRRRRPAPPGPPHADDESPAVEELQPRRLQ